MVFLTLEDLKGTCDIVFFPKVFAKHLGNITRTWALYY